MTDIEKMRQLAKEVSIQDHNDTASALKFHDLMDRIVNTLERQENQIERLEREIVRTRARAERFL